MANLPETPVWETGIYQLEETDPVQGGPNGIDNQQGKQLANRTAWLKSQVETLGTDKQPLDATLTALAAINGVADRIAYFTGGDTLALTPLTAFIRTLLDDGDASAARSTLGAISQTQLDAAISALVNSSPATLDTLNELAAALGNDANFATTVTNALDAKAPIASPVFTGDPKAPTPAQFDNDTSIATAEFVQRALGNMQGFRAISTNTTLSAADAGRLISSNAGTGSVTCQLPPLSSVPAGATFVISHSSSAMTTFGVAVSGADLLVFDGLGINASPYLMGYGETLVVTSIGSSVWKVTASNGAKMLNLGGAFGSLLSGAGYQKLPSGLIIQWGVSGAISSGSSATVTFPVAFPNACLQGFVSLLTGGGVTAAVSGGTQGFGTTGMTIQHYAGNAASGQWRWFAIGY